LHTVGASETVELTNSEGGKTVLLRTESQCTINIERALHVVGQPFSMEKALNIHEKGFIIIEKETTFFYLKIAITLLVLRPFGPD